MEGIDFLSFRAPSGNYITEATFLPEIEDDRGMRITWKRRPIAEDLKAFEAWVKAQLPAPVEITGKAVGWTGDPETLNRERANIEAWKKANHPS